MQLVVIDCTILRHNCLIILVGGIGLPWDRWRGSLVSGNLLDSRRCTLFSTSCLIPYDRCSFYLKSYLLFRNLHLVSLFACPIRLCRVSQLWAMPGVTTFFYATRGFTIFLFYFILLTGSTAVVLFWLFSRRWSGLGCLLALSVCLVKCLICSLSFWPYESTGLRRELLTVCI